MNLIRRSFSRSFLLRTSALSLLPLAIPYRVRASSEPGIAANGDTDPYPIPWLDKNGSHNQAAAPDGEPSHIYHFKGLVARSSTFVGMGTDNTGKRVAFGSATTDYGLMQGEYWAARAPQRGTFSHI